MKNNYSMIVFSNESFKLFIMKNSCLFDDGYIWIKFKEKYMLLYSVIYKIFRINNSKKAKSMISEEFHLVSDFPGTLNN